MIFHDTPELGTSWALDKNLERIHISQVPSGRDYYSCRGCKQELVAVKCKTRRSFFRHHASEQSPRKKCTYSDHDERLRIAIDSLQLLRRIKVPTVYKYPPAGQDGMPVKIASATFVDIYKIKVKQFFYEDDSCRIQWGEETSNDRL